MGLKVSSLHEAIEIAKNAGFEGLEIGVHEVANLIDAHGVEHVRAIFKDAGIRAAGWGLPVDWRGAEDRWKAGLAELPRLAQAASAIGSDRCFTWVMPCS